MDVSIDSTGIATSFGSLTSSDEVKQVERNEVAVVSQASLFLLILFVLVLVLEELIILILISLYAIVLAMSLKG